MKHAKEKGRRAELLTAQRLREAGFDAKRTPLSGAIPEWREDVTSPSFPLFIEVKNREAWQILEWYKTAEQKSEGKPVVIVATKNNEDLYCFMKLSDLLEIMKGKPIQQVRTVAKPKRLSLDETSRLTFSKKDQVRRAKK